MRERVSEISLMLWIFAIGVIIGGTIFQMFVIVPEWSGNMPDSLIQFFRGTNWAEAQGRFWQFQPFYLGYFCGFIALIAGWHNKSRRIWLLVSILLGIIAFLSTVFYFMPYGVVPLFFKGGEGLSPEEIVRGANDWIFWNKVRFVVLVLCFFSALKALSNSSPKTD
jgi:hypothetical protein